MKRTVLLCFSLLCLTSSMQAITHLVSVEDFEFDPAFITVNLGDTVFWMWDEGNHTTTSTSIPAGAASWDSPINSSNLFYIYVPTVAGTYNYICQPHSVMGMQGVITVNSSVGMQENRAEFLMNPYVSNGSLMMDYRLKTHSQVYIDLLSTDGRLVKQFAMESMPAGEYRNSYPLDGLTNGIYLVRLVADRQKLVHRIYITRP